MLPICDAPPDRSIWTEPTRKTFEQHVDQLVRLNPVPGACIASENPPSSDEYSIPFAIEKQLVEDFAFVAAWDVGVDHVTAACLEQTGSGSSSGSGRLTLRLAANEGVSEHAKSALKQILTIFERCARKTLSREACERDMFDVVVKLDRNRILGRLSSRHFRRPPYVREDRDPLPEVLIDLVKTRLEGERRNARSSKPADDILSDLSMFHCRFQELEICHPPDLDDNIKRTIAAASKVAGEDDSLPDRLRRLGFPESVLDSRDIRQLSKVANYRRICHNLAKLSRIQQYRSMFVQTDLKTLMPYEPIKSGGCPRFVHAEIQLVAYYERSSMRPWPRVIGVSKEACFLCHAFVKAHAHFCIPRAHRQVYGKWTVPDRKGYTSRTIDRFQSTLKSVDSAVLKEIARARARKTRQQFPLQSSVNIARLELPDGSATTLPSQKSSRDGQLSTKGSVAGRKDAQPQGHSLSLSKRSTFEGHGEASLLETNFPRVVTDEARLSGDGLATVEVGSEETLVNGPNGCDSFAVELPPWPLSITYDWLELHFHPPDASLGTGRNDDTPSSYSRTKIEFVRVNTLDGDSIERIRSLNIGDIPPSGEMTLGMSNSKDRILSSDQDRKETLLLELVLRHEMYGKILVRVTSSMP